MAANEHSDAGALDTVHHVAITVEDVARAVDWYRANTRCTVSYQDSTWALLGFENVSLALVLPAEHPPHLAVETDSPERYGTPVLHRDGTRSVYIEDSEGNAVEYIALA